MAMLLHDGHMPLYGFQFDKLRDFFQQSLFSDRGAVITDLDGTAVHEYEGRTLIHYEVETGLKKIADHGRPVIINTLRFPLSVIRTFGKDWYRISTTPVPVILLNGSQLGYILKSGDQFIFEQVIAFTLSASELKDITGCIRQLTEEGVNDIILFSYPEDWKLGEIIWTPDKERIPYLQTKYKSASSVISTKPAELEALLTARPLCMLLLLVNAANDKLMAYQHTGRNNFITSKGIDKLSGAREMAKHLHYNLADSVGAGDSNMDVFLNETGLSIHVRNSNLPYLGRTLTLQLQDYHEYGEVLIRLAAMQKEEKKVS